jgi:hypothetical protein
MRNFFKNHFSLLLFCAMLLLFNSCRVKKEGVIKHVPITIEDTTSINENAKAYLLSIQKNEIEYQWFAARLSVEYNDGKIEQSFNATLRMRKDSIVWLSLYGPFGIEGGRILITKDSLQIINRLSGEYSKRPLSSLKNYLPIQADLRQLQDFILGYCLKFDSKQISVRGIADSIVTIRQEDFNFQYDVHAFLQNYTIATSLLVDKMVKQQLDVTFDGYSEVAGKPFATTRNIIAKRQNDTLKLNLEFSKFRINEPLEFPFEISNNLKKVE